MGDITIDNEEKVIENIDLATFNENDKSEPSKASKLVEERALLQSRVLGGDLRHLKEKVAFILNKDVSSRNSDVELAWNYWLTFERDKFNGEFVTKTQFFELTRTNSIIRERARIQNVLKLYQSDDTVKRYRGMLQEQFQEEAVDDNYCSHPSYAVYIDETGKNDEFLSVGSLWMPEAHYAYDTKKEIDRWKHDVGIDYEFHFADLKKQKLEYFKEFFLKFLKLNPTICFKIITVKRSGINDNNKGITDLTFHLINKGILHEHREGRAPLPRQLFVYIDKEQEGSDSLKIENIKERLVGQRIDGLFLGDFLAIDSKSTYYLQAVDLFTASVNRKLNFDDTERTNNHKDELADYILGFLQFDINKLDQSNEDIDKSVIFNLTKQNLN